MLGNEDSLVIQHPETSEEKRAPCMFAYLGFQLEMSLYGAFLSFRSWRFLVGFLMVLFAYSRGLWKLSCVQLLVNVAGLQGPLLCPFKTRSTLYSHAVQIKAGVFI